ncbi:MAG: DUF499 domain-containing protein [Methanosarcinales archaeon]
MYNWFDVVEPHEDIKAGDFDESIFAADLGDVVIGDAPNDYNNPYVFFKKTYLTDGLKNLLKQVQYKLSTGTGNSVIEIQTPFGGGKTHSLVAIYHYIKNGENILDLLPDGLVPISAKIAVIVGTHLNPVEGRDIDGLNIKTLWGDSAYQLGGIEGYNFFAKTDKERISPGKDKLKEFLKMQEPFIILFDEILEYVNKAVGVTYSNTSLGSQTFAFFQELTETVASLSRGMIIAALPSSYLEDFGEKKEEALARLSKILGRLENIETPIVGEDVYAIIRKRLFADIKNESRKNEIIHKYFEFYQTIKDELPAKARDINFKRKLDIAYPFHPDLIDILYEKWGTFSSFQRTRGVLRLLANVIEDLYRREINIDLILPSDINLGEVSIRQEFLKHIGPEYEAIIGADIADHNAKAQSMDQENKKWKHLATRICTAVFFSFF